MAPPMYGSQSADQPAGRGPRVGKRPAADLPGEEVENVEGLQPNVVGTGRRFHRFIRGRVVDALVRNHGFDREEAINLVESSVSDQEIEEKATEHKIGAPNEGGGFLKWISDHMDQIVQLVLAIVKILSLFAAKPMKKTMTAVEKDQQKKAKEAEAETEDETEEDPDAGKAEK